MSKAQLKKELAPLDKEQLTEMILEAYSARKEIKDYFEFYLNPDPEALRKRYFDVMVKEFKRTKRGGYSKARISFIKKQLKEFASFRPGFDYELALMMDVVKLGLAMEMFINYSDTLMNGIARIMTDMVVVADNNYQAEKVLGELGDVLNDEKRGTRYFRRFLLGKLNELNDIDETASRSKINEALKRIFGK